MSSRSRLVNCLLHHVNDKLVSTRHFSKSGGSSLSTLSASSESSSSRRFGSGRRSISDDSTHSKTSANQSDPPGQSAGNTFNSKHIVQATHQALVRALSLRSSANIAIATADRAEADAARALSRAPAARALSDQTKAAVVLRSRAVDAVAAADRAQTEAAELRAGAGAVVGAGSGGSTKIEEASLRAAEQRSKADEAVAAAERAEAEVAAALAAIKVAHDAQARAAEQRSKADEAAAAAEREEIEARMAQSIAQAAATSAELGANIDKAQAEGTKAQAEGTTAQAVGQMKSYIAQNTRLWFQYGSLLLLGATGVLLVDYLWTENSYVAGVRLFFKMRRVTEPRRFDDDLVNREDLWRGEDCCITSNLVPSVVIGPMGVGKSALLRRFVKEQPNCIYIGLRGLDSGDASLSAKSTESSRDLSSICNSVMQQCGFPGRRSLFSVLFSNVAKVTFDAGGIKLESVQLVDASSKWERLWSAFDSALSLFKWQYPDRFVTIVFDEATFLAPADDDSKELAAFKSNWFDQLERRAIKSGHDVLDARFIFATSSPKLAALFNFDKFDFVDIENMSLEEMGTAIAAASKSALPRSDPNRSKDQAAAAAAAAAESKSMVSRRALTQSEGEYLAQSFGSIRTGIYFIKSDAFRVLRDDNSAPAFHNAVGRYRTKLVEQRLGACNAILQSMLLPEVVAQGGMETVAKVVAAFNKGCQQSQTSASPIKLHAQDKVLFGVFANLHEKSVLYLDGASRTVTFPYPEGWEAFQLAMKQIAPLVSAASVKK